MLKNKKLPGNLALKTLLKNEGRGYSVPGALRTFPRLRNRLRVNPVTPSQNVQALFTVLYRSTRCLCCSERKVVRLVHAPEWRLAGLARVVNPD
jgi:hypothetical protein